MNKRDEIKKLWMETFSDSPEYVDMYFSRVYRDDDALTLRRDDNQLVSALLLQPYKLNFHGSEVGADYICGAATRRSQRGKGLMTGLIHEALAESRRRGSMMTFLIPAETHLTFYYANRGFSQVAFVKELRYTAFHPFNCDGEYEPIENLYGDEVYNAFHRWETARGGSILHSQRDFLNILDDNRMDEGRVAFIKDTAGNPAGAGFAVVRDGIVVVTDLLGEDDDARTGAMRQLRGYFSDLPFKLLAPSGELSEGLTPRGMARIVNPLIAFEAIAAANRSLRRHIRVTDSLIPENSHIYKIDQGNATVDDNFNGNLDLDVTAEVLTAALFSSGKTGRVLGIPAERLHVSLMLD